MQAVQCLPRGIAVELGRLSTSWLRRTSHGVVVCVASGGYWRLAHISFSHDRQSLCFRMGDGLHREGLGPRPRIQRPVLCPERALGLGTSFISISDRCRLQHLWHLQSRVSVGVTDDQLSVRISYLHSDLPDRNQNLEREGRSLGDVDVGPVALHLVLVNSLYLGYDAFAISFELHFPFRPGTAGMAWSASLVIIWGAVGRGRATEPFPALVLTFQRIVGMESQAETSTTVIGGSCPGISRVWNDREPLAGAELPAVWEVRFCSR